MANKYQIIDGDGHVVEDLKAITGRFPEAVQQQMRWNNPFPPLDHLHSANAHKLPEGSFQQVGFDGWVEFLDDVGIDRTVLYPTVGLSYGKVISQDWAIDLARAYNDWIAENYVQKSPKFQAVALIPLQEPDEAVKELRRAVEDLGMCGAMLPSTGIQLHLGHKNYWPIYEEANRLGCCLGIHGGAHESLGMDDLHPYAPVHALGHPFGQMISFGGIVFNGIFDKFPNVRIGFLEGGVAWLLMCLERFDRSYETHIQHDPRSEFLQLKEGESVSQYCKRHIEEGRIFVGCEGHEPDLAHAIRMVGNKPWVYSSDFPHEVNNEFCKEELGEVMESEELTEEDKTAVLSRNAERFYNLPAGL